MKESLLQDTVLRLAKLYGWRPYHTYDSRRSHAGWPDLVLCRPPRLLFLELKSEKGRLSEEQRSWLMDLSACGAEVAVIRPGDLTTITEHLSWRNVRMPALTL